MTREEVREIASEVFMEHNQFLINGLIKVKPQMNTKEACQFLSCTRQWLSINRGLFSGKVINKRGDLRFEVSKIVEFKRKNL